MKPVIITLFSKDADRDRGTVGKKISSVNKVSGCGACSKLYSVKHRIVMPWG